MVAAGATFVKIPVAPPRGFSEEIKPDNKGLLQILRDQEGQSIYNVDDAPPYQQLEYTQGGLAQVAKLVAKLIGDLLRPCNGRVAIDIEDYQGQLKLLQQQDGNDIPASHRIYHVLLIVAVGEVHLVVYGRPRPLKIHELFKLRSCVPFLLGCQGGSFLAALSESRVHTLEVSIVPVGVLRLKLSEGMCV